MSLLLLKCLDCGGVNDHDRYFCAGVVAQELAEKITTYGELPRYGKEMRFPLVGEGVVGDRVTSFLKANGWDIRLEKNEMRDEIVVVFP